VSKITVLDDEKAQAPQFGHFEQLACIHLRNIAQYGGEKRMSPRAGEKQQLFSLA
jgi:hypothetical protein